MKSENNTKTRLLCKIQSIFGEWSYTFIHRDIITVILYINRNDACDLHLNSIVFVTEVEKENSTTMKSSLMLVNLRPIPWLQLTLENYAIRAIEN